MRKILRHLFVTEEEPLRSNWREAFPSAQLAHWAGARRSTRADLFWLVLPYDESASALVAKWKKIAGRNMVVALSDEPRDEEGVAVLQAGASGYCNGYAAPEVLRQVAQTVEQGGVWVGQSLLQKLVSAAARQTPDSPLATGNWAQSLTEREQAVALAVASGASNKEIAARLDITERTVKAHLSATFEKLKVRDRLQLTLLVNGLS
ncbi:MAG: response regulator transcription factor [Betaproteobacteria bacterium]|nr:response regulator transcription factor [Betaproteobacteria bacterium]MDE2622001.1 response regulator transcription factor [Betaproteobacteria bacterium]